MPDPCETCQRYEDCPWCPQWDPHNPPGGGGLFRPDPAYTPIQKGYHGSFLGWEGNGTPLMAQVVNVSADGSRVDVLITQLDGGRHIERNVIWSAAQGVWDDYVRHIAQYVHYRCEAMDQLVTEWQALGHTDFLKPVYLDGKIHLVNAEIEIFGQPVRENPDGTLNCIGWFGDQANCAFFGGVQTLPSTGLPVWKRKRHIWNELRTPLFSEAKRRIEEYLGGPIY